MKIICIGRNYSEHAKELNNAIPENPIFFMKPETALLRNNQPFYYPDFSKDIHHEVEIVVKIGRIGKRIEQQFAHRYISEIGIGIDFTARDLQQKCKEKGLPWEMAKAFDSSAPISSFLPVENFTDIHNLDFWLDINAIRVQTGNTMDMLFSFEQIISYTSNFVSYKMGDLIFTGTPSGVGSVKIGDRLQAGIGSNMMLDFLIK